jgi:hypothetical protein
VFGEPVLHGRGCKERGRTEQILAAAMAMASSLQRPRFGHAGFLAETGQRVIFAKEGDHRSAVAPFAHHGGGNACDLLGDAETLMAQLGQMFGGRARFVVADSGIAQTRSLKSTKRGLMVCRRHARCCCGYPSSGSQY